MWTEAEILWTDEKVLWMEGGRSEMIKRCTSKYGLELKVKSIPLTYGIDAEGDVFW